MNNITGIIIKPHCGFNFGETVSVLRNLPNNLIQIRKFRSGFTKTMKKSHIQLSTTAYDCSKNTCVINPKYLE